MKKNLIKNRIVLGLRNLSFCLSLLLITGSLLPIRAQTPSNCSLVVFREYDNDCKMDFPLWRETDGTFYILKSTTQTHLAFQQGTTGSFPLPPGDYNGDNISDFAVTHTLPDNKIKWYINSPQIHPNPIEQHYGTAPYDFPVPADYDGDGDTDKAVFRLELSGSEKIPTFYYDSNGSTNFLTLDPETDTNVVPIVNDFDGDGEADPGIWRKNSGLWKIKMSATGNHYQIYFGQAGDIPVPAHYLNNDASADIAVWRPSNGTWYVLNSSGGATTMPFGQTGDDPVPADYDGDGVTDYAVRRGTFFYVQRSSMGFLSQIWGLASDYPILKPAMPFFSDTNPPHRTCPTGCKAICPPDNCSGSGS